MGDMAGLVSEATAREVLAEVAEPNLRRGLVAAGVVDHIAVTDDRCEIALKFPYPARAAFAEIVAAARPALLRAGFADARFAMTHDIAAHTVQGGARRLDGVKNIIAVASAKGGVGKSTTTANLALALAAEGARVGILDTDIYGPSLPVMLGVNRRPQGDESGIEPVEAHGLKLMSMGFLVGEEQAMVWRAPIVTRTLLQFLKDTRWGDLDYLFLDMPPGTGDVQLTVAQQAPVTGAVVVTTPQDLAVSDARRGVMMFRKVSIPALGVVENMSWYRCPKCGNEERIFGAGGAEKMCAEFDAELLGALPLQSAIRDAADNGAPTVLADPGGEVAGIYRRIATRAAAKISEKSKDRGFPDIVVTSE